MNFSAAFNEDGTTAGFAGTYGNPNAYFIALYGGTGYSGASDWRSQMGAPKGYGGTDTVGTGMPLPSGSISSYHFLADAAGDNIVVVVEKTSGIFGHMFWGTSLSKLGTWTGGAYFGACMDGWLCSMDNSSTSYPGCGVSSFCPGTLQNQQATYVKANVDAFTSKWIGIGAAEWASGGYTGKNGGSNVTEMLNAVPGGLDLAYLIDRGTSNLTGQSLLFPITLSAARDTVGYSLLGSIPNIFLTNACNKGFAQKGIYQWGSDDYMVFPGSTISIPLSKNYGFAIKKV
jgi:hypothetical protein